MREIAQLQRKPFYNVGITKRTIAVCAIGGIFLGTLFFRFANLPLENLSNIQTKVLSESAAVSKKFDTALQPLFKVFGIDFYNPITILNLNYPYFRTFYYDKYLEYVAQKEKEELERK